MEKISYNNFWQGLHAQAREQFFPLRVMFELTYECNFKCKHCYVPGSYRKKYKKKQLKADEIFSILGQLKDSGCFYLGFTGGEPLARPDIIRVLRYARKLGFQIILYSNGSFFDKKTVGLLADIFPNKVDITLPGMSRAVFEKITGVSGSHQAVFQGIDLLKKKKISLGFKTCLLKENAGEIKEIRAFCRSLHASHRLDTLLSARLDGSAYPYKYRGGLPAVPTKEAAVEEITLKENRSGEPEDNDALFACGAGLSQAAITPGGELKLCLMIDYPKYDLRSIFLKQSWEKMQRFVQNIIPDKRFLCPACGLKPYCAWCPARSWLYNKTFYSCEPQIRAWAGERKKEYAGGNKT